MSGNLCQNFHFDYWHPSLRPSAALRKVGEVKFYCFTVLQYFLNVHHFDIGVGCVKINSVNFVESWFLTVKAVDSWIQLVKLTTASKS